MTEKGKVPLSLEPEGARARHQAPPGRRDIVPTTSEDLSQNGYGVVVAVVVVVVVLVESS